MDASLTDRIRAQVEAGFADQIAFLERLVAFPSMRGRERPAQEFMADALRSRGLDVDQWKIDVEDLRNMDGFSPVTVSYEDALGVVGTHRGGSGRSLIVNGHMDVVPPGPEENWDSPPFAARIEADRIYGRGAGDMKAGLAAAVFAYDALRRAGLAPAGDIYFQSVIEEECTGNGALACLQRGYSADAVLIPEPTSGKYVAAQLGVIWFSVTVKARSHHVLEAETGGNAIRLAHPIIEAAYALGETWNEPARRHPAFRDVNHPINVNVGRIAGGDWPSIVPSRCTIDMRIGVYPDQDLEEARREIEAMVAAVVARHPQLQADPPEISYNGFLAPGFVAGTSSDALDVLGEVHQGVTGRELEHTLLTATTDGRTHGLYGGIPTLVYGHHAENIHGANEFATLSSIRDTTVAIACFMAEWCGVTSR